MRKRSILYPAVVLVLLVTFLFGCGKDKDFTAKEGAGGSGQETESESVQPTNEPDEKDDDKEENLIAEEEPVIEGASEEQDEVEDNHQIVIRVENRKVLCNGIIIEYDQNDVSKLKEALKEVLSGCNDETQIILDLNQGDDEICSIVENVIRQMGMTSAVQSDNT